MCSRKTHTLHTPKTCAVQSHDPLTRTRTHLERRQNMFRARCPGSVSPSVRPCVCAHMFGALVCMCVVCFVHVCAHAKLHTHTHTLEHTRVGRMGAPRQRGLCACECVVVRVQASSSCSIHSVDLIWNSNRIHFGILSTICVNGMMQIFGIKQVCLTVTTIVRCASGVVGAEGTYSWRRGSGAHAHTLWCYAAR